MIGLANVSDRLLTSASLGRGVSSLDLERDMPEASDAFCKFDLV